MDGTTGFGDRKCAVTADWVPEPSQSPGKGSAAWWNAGVGEGGNITDPETRSPRVLRDRYELECVIGGGTQGRVWRARDRQHDRVVAVKERVVEDGDAQGVLAEARMLLDLRPHPALPIVRDDFFDGDRYFLVIDWIEGSPSAWPLDYETALEVTESVAAALDHLHSHVPPICHRDVKPANILIGPNGPVLVDFGLATRRETLVAAGTRHHLAPELAGPHPAPASAASDVYALAVTVHLLLTGSLPEPGRAPELASVPEAHRDAVASVLSDGLAVDPTLRPPAGEFAARLRPPPGPTNLGAPVQAFIGRHREAATLRNALRLSRFVTVTGAGGVGKSALAFDVARAERHRFPGGVWLADLAAASPDDVAARVDAAVGGDRSLPLADRIGDDRVLLVLDTCERVADAVVTLVDDLLTACEGLVALCTSRARLRGAGERVVPVDPLSDDDGVALFLDRSAAGVGAGDDVRDLVAALDSLPLALELAAARTTEMSVAAMTEALVAGASSDVLVEGPRTRPRHETIDAVIRWSWDLLSTTGQVTLRRVSVFAGGFRHDAVPAITGGSDGLQELIDSSLVLPAAAVDGEPRARLLDTVRDFASARLHEAGDVEVAEARLATWALDFVTRAVGDEVIAERSRWADVVAAETDTLLRVAGAGATTSLVVADMACATWSDMGRPAIAEAALRAALASAPAEAHADVEVLTSAHTRLAALLSDRGMYEEAAAALATVAGFVARCSPEVRAGTAGTAGTLAGRQGRLDEAIASFESGLRALEGVASGRARREASTLRHNLATALTLAGRLDDAAEIATEQLAAARQAADDRGLVHALAVLGQIEAGRADHRAAARATAEAVAVATESGFTAPLPALLVNLSLAWARGDDPEAGARAWGAAEQAMDGAGFVIPPSEVDAVNGELAWLRDRVGPGRFDELVEEGRTLDPAQLVATLLRDGDEASATTRPRW